MFCFLMFFMFDVYSWFLDESLYFSSILWFKHVHKVLYSCYFEGSLCFYALQEFLEFEEGFYEQWGKSLLPGTNFFSDPRGNVINIEFEPIFLLQRQFRAVEQLMGFYDLNDVYYVVSLYCGDRYFRMRLFDLDWTEVVYPGRRNNGLARDPLSSVRFFKAFRVHFIPNTVWNFSPFFLVCSVDL